MNKYRQEIGQKGEEKAAEFLQKIGYKLIARNYRCRFGEIDIIAFEDNNIVFVEVKSRTNDKFGIPTEAVNRRKQQKIRQIAENYLNFYGWNGNCRFDVVAVKFYKEYEKIDVYKNAF